MAKVFKLKACINKKNGQINFSLPKKKLSKKALKKIFETKEVKLSLA